MVCSDHETRVGAHRIFSIVLVPSSVCPRPCPDAPCHAKANEIQRTLSRTVSVFSSSAALFEKLKKDESSTIDEPEAKNSNDSILNRLKSTYSRTGTVKRPPMPTTTVSGSEGNMDVNMHSPSLLNRLKSRAYTKRNPSTETVNVKPIVSEKEPVCNYASPVLSFKKYLRLIPLHPYLT